MEDLLVFSRIFIREIIEPGKKYQIKQGMTIELSPERQLCGEEPIPGKRYDLFCSENGTAAFLPAAEKRPR